MTRRMLPTHAADIAEILAFMPRAALVRLNRLLDDLRRGLHERRAAPAPPRAAHGPARS